VDQALNTFDQGLHVGAARWDLLIDGQWLRRWSGVSGTMAMESLFGGKD
jgi:hypothetical protein